METENNVALEAFSHAQEINLHLAMIVVTSWQADPPAWDSIDFWLFVGCCCRVADSVVVLLSDKDGAWTIAHIGFDVAKRHGYLYVVCLLDNITKNFTESFEDPEVLQRILHTHNTKANREGAEYKCHMFQFGSDRTIEEPIEFRGLDKEAWKMITAASWAAVTHRCFPRPVADPGEYRRLLLVNLTCGLSAEEAQIYVWQQECTYIPFDETWRRSMARHLRLLKGTGCCKWCDTDLTQCDDLQRHFMSCAPRCQACQCVDHRVAQMAFCRCIHPEREAVVLLEDVFFVLQDRSDPTFDGQDASILLGSGLCIQCVIAKGMRPGQVTTVQQRHLNSEISVRPVTQDYQLPDTGFSLNVEGHIINFTTLSFRSRCDNCGAPPRFGASLRKCCQCKGFVKYCSKECQRSNWEGHKEFCKLFKDLLP